MEEHRGIPLSHTEQKPYRFLQEVYKIQSKLVIEPQAWFIVKPTKQFEQMTEENFDLTAGFIMLNISA